ncbi:MAG: hypothetical protein ACLU6B_03285 [Lachnospirales bacterium]
MNKKGLRSVMALYGDTCQDLAHVLNIARSTLSAKMNETRGAEFTQSEITTIKAHYSLTPEQVSDIFFNQIPS